MLLGTKIEDMSNKCSDYMELMRNLFEVRGKSDKFEKFESWITGTDFFTAPASTRFHGSFEGGLCEHHIDVYNETVDLLTLSKFKNVNPDSAYLVALVHDFCKIGQYVPYMRNVKNDETSQWEKVQAYKYDKPAFPFGHGVTSMWIASKFLPMSMEEMLAVRWHMGSYRCTYDELGELQESNERYPLVLLLQFADQLSITGY